MSARHCARPRERPCRVEIPSLLPTPEDPPGCSSSAGQRTPRNPSARAVGSAPSGAWGGASAPACLDMAGQRGGLPLPLLLLSLAGLVPHLALGTTATDVTVTVSTAHPTSPTPMETSALLPTSTSTTAATVPPSSPETGASTPERSSTSPGPGSTSSLTTPPPTTPAPTAASAEPLTTPSDTTATPDTSTGVRGSTPAPSQPAGTTARATPGISTMTSGLVPGTPTASETPSAATGMEPSSPATNSTQTPEVTLSTPADLPTTLPVCPTAMSNTSASHLFLSLRLTVPLDLGNTTVQELVLSKLRRDLQTAFPFAGLAVEWRGHRRT
ncbi:uncharacterized protein ACIBXB_021851 isoform 2-T2 [Morphnus guianensis]